MEEKILTNECKETEKNEEKFKNSQSFSFAPSIVSENFQIENIEMEGHTSLNTPSRCSYIMEESFMEFQEIGTSANDPYSEWYDDFEFDQSKLQTNYVDPNSVNTELKQKTTDEILFEETIPGSNMEPTSDLNLGTVSRSIDYNSENSSG
ncbi:hypothetical protein TNCT_558541 [Trichonephila clavata]|uniref:Uncharacterized protein n=1 Tax=Trichonephila clavata TaxID=2740835 RepID=A0A8X6I062_TRICU|nr:hypothetical protein TNCT_558541 [Trichonephila clavata]